MLKREYLGYIREFEILSGLGRENDAIIDELIHQIQCYSPEVICDIEVIGFEELVEEESSVGISRRKLRKIREKKLTAEQVDDLMDETEARLAERKRLQDEPKSASPDLATDNKDDSRSDLDDQSHSDDKPEVRNLVDQPKLTALSYMNSLGLLGRVLRNSEFTTKKRKIDGVRLYIQGSVKLFLYINEIVADVFAGMVATLNEDEEFIDEEAGRALRYF